MSEQFEKLTIYECRRKRRIHR